VLKTQGGYSMNALLLNGARESDIFSNKIGNKIINAGEKEGWKIDPIILRDKNIGPCRGCFNCWIKTPGQCIIKDDAQEVVQKIVKTDLLIYLTPIIFGGYSYHLKKVLDRSIGIIMPFFRKVEGEVHHKMRYKQYPYLLGIGIDYSADPNNAKLFDKLIERNSLNFEVGGFESKVISPDTKREDIQNELTVSFRNVGETL
jgi:multimeric flavodoxin WrbA